MLREQQCDNKTVQKQRKRTGENVPSGKVKWFDADKGFGFIVSNEGDQVFLHASSLPAGMKEIAAGTKVEFSVADSRRGPQALTVQVLEDLPSVAKSKRTKPAQMVPIVEDLIKMLDGASASLRRGKYPDNSQQVAKVLRVVAQSFDA